MRKVSGQQKNQEYKQQRLFSSTNEPTTASNGGTDGCDGTGVELPSILGETSNFSPFQLGVGSYPYLLCPLLTSLRFLLTVARSFIPLQGTRKDLPG